MHIFKPRNHTMLFVTGWVVAHDALRDDMADISSAFTKVSSGSIVDWQIENMKAVWPLFASKLHHHHANEETIVFPFMKKKCEIPTEMVSAHGTLDTKMEQMGEMVDKLGKDPDLWRKLSETFNAFKIEMEEHLKMEEDIGLIMVRIAFDEKTFEAEVVKKIIKDSTPEDLGWILRHMKSDKERKVCMTEVARVPGLVQSMIMIPAVKKWWNKFGRPLDEMKAGERILPQPTSCCVVQ